MIIESLKYPLEIEIQVTEYCNLKCNHCFGDYSKDSLKKMNYSKLKILLAEIAEKNIPRVTFSGGEPLIYEEIFDGIKYAKELGLETRLLTNSLMLTEEKIKKLKNNGLASIGISIDGNEEEHDKNRGNGTFKKTLLKIREVSELGLPVSVNFLVHSDNFSKLDDTLELILSYGVSFIVLLPLQIIGRAKNNMKDKCLNSNQLYYLHNKFENDATKSSRVFIHGPLNCLLKDVPLDVIPDINEWTPCAIGQTRLGILCDGETHPCVPTGISLGNVFEKSIEEVWNTSCFLNEIRNINNLDDECKTCEYISKCVGGCRIASFIKYGSINKKDPCCFK